MVDRRTIKVPKDDGMASMISVNMETLSDGIKGRMRGVCV